MPDMKNDLPRIKHKISEVDTENKFLEEIEKKHFNPDECPINEWLMGIFNIKKTPHLLVASIAKFFSLFLKIPLPREAYRRRICCMYWMKNNIDAIFYACYVFKLSCKSIDGNTYYLKSYSEPLKSKTTKEDACKQEPPEEITINVFDEFDYKSDASTMYFDDDMFGNDLFE